MCWTKAKFTASEHQSIMEWDSVWFPYITQNNTQLKPALLHSWSVTEVELQIRKTLNGNLPDFFLLIISDFTPNVFRELLLCSPQQFNSTGPTL